jgi:hypothetical protein
MLAVANDVAVGKMNVAEACRIHNVSRSTYYRWLYEDAGTVEDFRTFISQNQRGVLVSTLSIQEQLVNLIIKDALSETTDPLSRLAIAKFIFETIGSLAEKHRATGNDSARRYLTGPVQELVESRLGQQADVTSAELLIKFSVSNESKDDQGDIIDGEFSPATPVILED